MDLFDDDFNEQIERLDQLENELRAEIQMDMDIEVDVGALGDRFDIGRLVGRVGENAGVPRPGRDDNGRHAAGDVPMEEGHQENDQGEEAAAVDDQNIQVVENPRGDKADPSAAGGSAKAKEEKEDEDPILTSKGAEMKGFSCMICYDPFNTGKRIPKVFPCGHTFCLTCVGGLMKNRTYLSRSTVMCPTCRQNTQYSMTLGADKVPTNYSILSMLEQRKEEKTLKAEGERLECTECQTSYDGTEVTLCNEEKCQKADEGEEIDSIKRLKGQLICRSCVEKNHSRHNFTPFKKVQEQYEASKSICTAESYMMKGLKAADDALLVLRLTEKEVLDHRRRIANALENIRSEADHPFIYEYLNRYITSVKASEDLFKSLTFDMAEFDFKSKARYYRAFGYNMLRPISVVPGNQASKGLLDPKVEPRDDGFNVPRIGDREQRLMNRDQGRRARINIIGPFHARNRGGGAAGGPADGELPNIANMFDQIMQQIDAVVGPDPLGAPARRGVQDAIRRRMAAPLPGAAAVAGAAPVDNAAPVANVVPAINPAPAVNQVGVAPDPPVPRDPRDNLGIGNRLNMWGVRAPLMPRRNRRNEHWRDLRAVRNNLVAAVAANPNLQGVPEIQQAIDDLRDRGDNIMDNDILMGRRNPLFRDQAQLERDMNRAEGDFNRLRQRFLRLREVAAGAAQPEPPAAVAAPAPAPVPFVDQIIEAPLAPLPPIDGYDQEEIHRAEIVELVQRVIGMVRNEANAEADANGLPQPANLELPALLNADAAPGGPDYRNLQPVQVEPFLADLRALELDWIQRGRDRRARAARFAEEPENRAGNEPADAPAAPENDVARDAQQRAPSPIPDEPAVKRNRR